MKFIVCFLFSVVALSLLEDTVAHTQDRTREVKYQHLLYYPAPTNPPRSYRVRRQVLGGSVATNPNGGENVKLDLTKGIGTENHNLVGQAFAAGNTAGGPATLGGALAYNKDGHGLSLSAAHTPGVGDSFSQSAHANLLQNSKHRLDANVFAEQNKLANGFKFERNGAGLDYNHANGHSFGIKDTHIPSYGNQLGLSGNANLWKSHDQNTRLDLSGGASQWLSGPQRGQRDYNVGLGLQHRFRFP